MGLWVKFVAKKKTATGSLRDRDGKHRKYAILIYIQKENQKKSETLPLRDRYGTVTAPV